MKKHYEEPWFDAKKFTCADIITGSEEGEDVIPAINTSGIDTTDDPFGF